MQLVGHHSFSPSDGQPFSSVGHSFVAVVRHVEERQNADAEVLAKLTESNAPAIRKLRDILLMEALQEGLHEQCQCRTR